MNIRKQQILLCPGPVIVSSSIFEAVANNIGHREEEFSELLAELNDKLLNLFEIRKKNNFYPLIITGSGTVANETVLSSIVGDRKILIISNGEFGERLFKISKLHNRNTKILKFEWGEEINVEKVRKYILKNKVDIVAIVHHETSTGMLNPVDKIGKITKELKNIFIVDCVSSVAAEKIDMEKWNISFCTASAGKAICSLPGIGIIIAKKSAINKLKNTKPRTMYMNLFNLYYYSKKNLQTPNTPAVHLFYALDHALSNILKKGVEEWRNEIKRKALIFRQGMSKMGLSFLIDESNMSSSLTTVFLPRRISSNKLRSALKEKNIVVYNGKGPLLGKIFQVGHIGEIKGGDIRLFLDSLRDVSDARNRSNKKKNSSRTSKLLHYNLHFPIPFKERI